MCHTFKHLLICNTFCCWLILLSLSLYIELALVCCMNPNNVNCFGTIFPNLNFVFASIWTASPVHIESDQYRSCSTVKQGPAVSATPSTPIGEQPKAALWLWVCEITCYLYTRWVHGRMKTKQRRFKVTRELSHHHHCVLPLVAGELKPFFWRAVLVCLVLGCFGVVVTSFSAMLLSWSMRFWMLVAVVLSLFGLSENISLLYTLYSPTRCRTSQSSRTCFWDSTSSPHALQVWFRYLFL